MKELLNRITMLGFVLLDVNLYLDTHPKDKAALAFYDKYNNLYNMAVSEYESKYGPLTAGGSADETRWEWALQNWPWQKGVK